MATPEQVFEALHPVIEPELGLPVLDLGLVYAIDLNDAGNEVTVIMTLTSPMCPIAPYLMELMRQAALTAPGITEAKVELTWDPPWDPYTMATEEARMDLGLA